MLPRDQELTVRLQSSRLPPIVLHSNSCLDYPRRAECSVERAVCVKSDGQKVKTARRSRVRMPDRKKLSIRLDQQLECPSIIESGSGCHPSPFTKGGVELAVGRKTSDS